MDASSINYALRVLKPVLDGDAASIEVKPKAEHDYVYWVQDALSQRVWNAGCVSVSFVKCPLPHDRFFSNSNPK